MLTIGAPGSLIRAEAEGLVTAGYVAELQRMRGALEEIRRYVALWAKPGTTAEAIDNIARRGLDA